ncbi:hypothetical protein Tco_0802638 [Tanacetum coccineum]|uniref:Uncharacterized protein n=1 Tax=Tanacetum coccineum TaxID=301880 RepID=A0ABQ4ZZC5_9ASTR
MIPATTARRWVIDYALESATRILNMVPTKKVDKTPYELWYGNKFLIVLLKFFEKKLITQEVSGRAIDLEEIKFPSEVEGFEHTHEEEILIRWSERTHRCYEWEYKPLMGQYGMGPWVDLPPGCKTVGRSLRIHIKQRIAAMIGYRGGSGGCFEMKSMWKLVKVVLGVVVVAAEVSQQGHHVASFETKKWSEKVGKLFRNIEVLVIEGASFTQRTISSISVGGSISSEGFLSSILLVVVIIVMVVIVVVILIVIVVAIVGVVIVVMIFGVVVVVDDVSLIFKLSSE